MNIIEHNNESDNKNDSEKKRRNRPCKNERYNNERKELMTELERIMGLTEEKRCILLYDLEENEELKEYLKVKIPEIKRIYKYASWNYFKEDEKNRNVIGLLKSLFKNENYDIINKRVYTEKNGERKQSAQFFFIKELNLKKILNKK